MKLKDVKNGDMFVDQMGDLCIVTDEYEVVYFKKKEKMFCISRLGDASFGSWLGIQNGPVLGNINDCFAGILDDLPKKE